MDGMDLNQAPPSKCWTLKSHPHSWRDRTWAVCKPTPGEIRQGRYIKSCERGVHVLRLQSSIPFDRPVLHAGAHGVDWRIRQTLCCQQSDQNGKEKQMSKRDVSGCNRSASWILPMRPSDPKLKYPHHNCSIITCILRQPLCL